MEELQAPVPEGTEITATAPTKPKRSRKHKKNKKVDPVIDQ